MTRREFLGILGWGSVWGSLGGLAAQVSVEPKIRAEHKYGHIDVHTPGACWLRVFLNGKRVSCVELNDEEGWVRVCVKDKQGQIQHPLRYVKLYGDVVVKPMHENDASPRYVLTRMDDK